MKTQFIFISIFLICCSSFVNAQTAGRDSLEKAFFAATEDSVKRNRLESLMYYYAEDPDTPPEEAFRQLQLLVFKKGDPNMNYLLLLFRVIILHTNDSIIETRKYLSEFLEQCRDRNDLSNRYILGLVRLSYAESYWGNYETAFKYLFQALDIARDTLEDKEQTAGIYLQLGILHYEQRDTLRAIDFNKKELQEFAEVKSTESMAAVSNNLAMQYSALAQYDSAKFYFRESIRLFHIAFEDPKLRNPLMNLGEVFRLTSEYDSAIFYIRNAISNANELNDEEAIGSGYWHLANTFRDKGISDSALKYFLLAQENIEKLQPQLAGMYFYPDLARFYASEGQHKLAYEYLQKATAIKDIIFNEDNNKVLKEMDVKYQASQKEKEILKQEEQIKRQRIVSYSVIAIAVFFLLLVFFIYRSYRMKRKANIIITHEKKRSDDLLLNILPSEVAEELKTKGSTDAKQFDNVTVMFTDFKGFTQISEKLSPAELVAEIHTCFKAFDNIIEKHNVEKIKTIGDSYMCAGGLPVANKTNADDVVKAAIEIQQFMQQHLQLRKSENKEPFEIRIGIHSGPVVAGIVGVKKFAYDIWGDTVNIASRMESSGEAGKVNISGSTYELVRNKFICTHRGKIQAKNKGEVDMYFVEGKA